nr:MAG TPA: hypothetical protein [Caudoviricetes sp.]
MWPFLLCLNMVLPLLIGEQAALGGIAGRNPG